MVVKVSFKWRLAHSMLSAAAIALIANLPIPARSQSATQGPVVPVTVSTVSRQDVPIWAKGLGTVQAYYAVQLRPRIDGTLMQVPVKEGQDVKKGELLAVIDPRPYQAILLAASAKKQQDQAQLANAQADLTRYASLVRQDFASRQQYETQQAMVKQFAASILGDDSQIDAAQLNLSFCYITAPFDGRVGLRLVDPGNLVRSAETTPIVSVMQIQPISVVFTLPQDDLPSVMRAMEQHPLEADAYASDNKTLLDHGVLLTPDNMIDVTTGMIRLKATFPNAHRTLWPGQFVNIRLLMGVESNVIAVAAPAVQHAPSGLYVYKVGANNTVTVQPIEVSRQQDDVYVVASGLDDGAVVVTAGQSRLQAGTHIAAREAKPTPDSSAKSGG